MAQTYQQRQRTRKRLERAGGKRIKKAKRKPVICQTTAGVRRMMANRAGRRRPQKTPIVVATKSMWLRWLTAVAARAKGVKAERPKR